MSVPSRRLGLRRLVECAVLIAIGTVLSLFEFSGPWALGGGITVCMYQGGTNIAECITFGRIAGKNAAAFSA